MKKYIFTIRGLFVILVLLISCAFSQVTPEKPLSVGLNNYKNFALSVESEVTEDVEKELSDLRGLVLSKVMSLNVFDKVKLLDDTKSEESTVLLKIKIVDFNSRDWLSALFTNEAYMTNKLLFIDAATNDTLGEYSVTGKSGSLGSGGSKESIDKTINAIIEVISYNFNK